MPGANSVALVFAAAPLTPTARLTARLAELDRPYVVAADGGAATALAFGFLPDVVVGDLDSIDASTLADLRQRRVPIEIFPRDKSATDGQLGIERALLVRPACLWLLGFLGGPRLDQGLASVLYLASLGTPALLLDEHNEATLVLPGEDAVWRTQPDEVVSLIPLATEVVGIRTAGLRWPLDGERLPHGSTRGVSNEPNAPEARVKIEYGRLLVTRHFPYTGTGL